MVRGRCEDTRDDALLTIVVVEYIDVERLDEKVIMELEIALLIHHSLL